MSIKPDYIPFAGLPEYDANEMLTRAKSMRDLLQTRRTIRDFSDRPVAKQLIATCTEAAASAPSGANHQPWHFVAISNPDIKRKIRIAAEAEERAFYQGKAGQEWLEALSPLGTDPNKPFLETAPWLIAIFAQKRGGEKIGQDKKNYYINESVGIATGMLITALHSVGLATLTHTPAPMVFLRDICKRPKTEKPFVLLVTGYPDKKAVIPKHALIKKSLADICTFEE